MWHINNNYYYYKAAFLASTHLEDDELLLGAVLDFVPVDAPVTWVGCLYIGTVSTDVYQPFVQFVLLRV